jgi:hypothetical protein
MSFTAALHTYFKISAIGNVSVSGLDSLTYTDSLQGGQSMQQSGDVIFDQEVDRIYLAVPDSGVQVCWCLVAGCSVGKHKTCKCDACRALGLQMAWQCSCHGRCAGLQLTLKNCVLLCVVACSSLTVSGWLHMHRVECPTLTDFTNTCFCCVSVCLPAWLQISDSGAGAVVEVHKAGFPDAVVWNPWVAKAQAMGDFGDEEYKV